MCYNHFRTITRRVKESFIYQLGHVVVYLPTYFPSHLAFGESFKFSFSFVVSVPFQPFFPHLISSCYQDLVRPVSKPSVPDPATFLFRVGIAFERSSFGYLLVVVILCFCAHVCQSLKSVFSEFAFKRCFCFPTLCLLFNHLLVQPSVKRDFWGPSVMGVTVISPPTKNTEPCFCAHSSVCSGSIKFSHIIYRPIQLCEPNAVVDFQGFLGFRLSPFLHTLLLL